MAINRNHIDVWRALQEPTYASRLTKEQWRDLFAMPEWSEVTGEFPELAELFINVRGRSVRAPCRCA